MVRNELRRYFYMRVHGLTVLLDILCRWTDYWTALSASDRALEGPLGPLQANVHLRA